MCSVDTMAAWETYLKDIYYDPNHAAAFSGPNKLYQIVKREGLYRIGRHKITKWLQDQDGYSLLKPIKYKFKRNRVVVPSIDYMWDMDLADVSNLEKYNHGIKFFMVVIDVFSRYVWVILLKDKKHDSIIKGLDEVLKQGRKPTHIRTDKGSEFKNKWVKNYFKKKRINYFVTHNETKANYAERVIRTLKTMMYRYFMYKQTYKYKNVIQDLVANYNNSSHRSLKGRAPIEITKENEATVWLDQYIPTKQPPIKKEYKVKLRQKYKFKVGDYVRLSHVRHVFQRDYQQKWTEEIFIISQRKHKNELPVYKVTEYDGSPLEGTFYEYELQRVQKDKDSLWRVDKIIKKRKRKGKEEWFVSFVGWPKKFNQWLRKEDVTVI